MARPLRTRRRPPASNTWGRRPAWAAPRRRPSAPLEAACRAAMGAAVAAVRAGQVVLACHVVARSRGALVPVLITREVPNP